MENKDPILSLIFKRFPDYKNYINELFCESTSFKLLCKDYYDCITVLDTVTQNKNKLDYLQKEYQLVLTEIEDELIERISV